MKLSKLHIILSLSTILSVNTIYATNNSDNIVKEITPYLEATLAKPASLTFIDSKEYAQLSADGTTIDYYDAVTGKKTQTVFDATRTRETTIARVDGFRFSDDKSKILLWNDINYVYRRSFKARYYVYDVRTRQLWPLSNDFEYQQVPVFSPDGRMVAFVYENNIYLKKLDFNTQVAVTTDGHAGSIINGATDWTYEEEFSTVSAMAFSPDNNVLCYVKTNETEVPVYSFPLYAGYCDRNDKYALYPGSFSYKYPVAGCNNSRVTLHAYEISNRKTKDIELPDKTIEYIPRIDFTPSSDKLLVSTLNRDQNRLEIYAVNPRTALTTSVFAEKSKAWILPETYEGMKVLQDGFVLMLNNTGYTHLYKYAFNGTLTRTITRGNFDVTAFYGMDATGTAYYQAAHPTPVDRTVYKVDNKGITAAVSPDKGGSASATFSPDLKLAVLNYSNCNTPNTYTLIDAKGKNLRVLEDNSAYINNVAGYPAKQFLEIPGNDGLTFNAYVIKPADFNPAKKYPVVVYQYSGPGSQSVLNRWSYGWEQYFADKGFVIFCMDGRGTGGRGADFMYSVYQNLGYYETIDQLAGVKWLSNQSWVDSGRIGMHGWSYGGYETLMCLQHKDSPFKAGVAVAPVTDWRLYDTVYTERYMLTPQQNEDGYNISAPLNHTDNLDSRLLLMAGTADDNVHIANTYEYAASLQYAGKLFDMMVFPNKNHSIYGCNARAVVYGNMFRFFLTNL